MVWNEVVGVDSPAPAVLSFASNPPNIKEPHTEQFSEFPQLPTETDLVVSGWRVLSPIVQ